MPAVGTGGNWGPGLLAGSHSSSKTSVSNNKNSAHYLLFTMYQASMPRALNILFHLIIPGSLSSAIVISVLEIKKLRNREVKQLARGHTTYK